MADPPSSPERKAGPDGGPAAGIPRWVKVSGIIASVKKGAWSADQLAPAINHTIEVFGPDRVMWAGDWPVCTLVLLTGGNHGPGRHRASGRLGGPVGSVDAIAQGRR